MPILIYTMAKVASSSVYHSIHKQSKQPIYHLHSLNEQKIKAAVKACFENGVMPASRSVGDLIYREKIEKNLPVKIITSVREPIARNLSAFFEAFEYYTGVQPINWTGKTENLFSLFYQELPQEFPLQWFDEELQRMTGIDVYAKTFDASQKYQFYQKGNTEVLLFRTDLSNQKKTELIQSFLGLKDFSLQNYNVGSDKSYAQMYQQFKKQIHFPEDYLHNMLTAKYTQHFFSEVEIQQMYKQYLNS